MEWWKTSHTAPQGVLAKAAPKGAKRAKVDCAQNAAQSTLFAFVGKKDVAKPEPEPEESDSGTEGVPKAAVGTLISSQDVICVSDVPATPSPCRVSIVDTASSASSSMPEESTTPSAETSQTVGISPDSPSQVEPARRSARLKSMKVQHALKEDFSSSGEDEFQPRKSKTKDAPPSKGRLFFMTREEKERLKAEEEQRIKEEEEEMQRERERQHCERLREEIKRAKEENLQRSLGRQTNPFLLPRAPVAAQPIVIDGDEEVSKLNNVLWEDDQDGALWPFPLIPHVTQYAPSDLGHSAVCIHEDYFPADTRESIYGVHLTSGKCSDPNLTSYATQREIANECPVQPRNQTTKDTYVIDHLAKESGWAVQDLEQLLAQLSQRHSLEDGRKQWVDIYRPRCAQEVCGNQKEVQQLRRWLLEKHSDNSQKNQKTSGRGRKADSDDDYEDGGDQCSQAILVVGPSGSGKSAAIYAVAEELQLQVLEINSSDKRCGRLVLDKVGEATRSQSLSKRAAAPQMLVADGGLLGEKGKSDGSERKDIDQPKNSKGSKGKRPKEDVNPDESSGLKAVILFEEIDVLLDHDKGFLAAVIALVQQTCVPIIMTCEKKPSVMEGLGLQQITWKRPDIGASAVHLQLIAAVEGYLLPEGDASFLYNFCHGDLRHALMLLQLAACNQEREQIGDPKVLRFPESASHSHLRLPSAVSVARGPIDFNDFQATMRCLGSDKSGVELFARSGSAGTCRILDSPGTFIDLLFSTSWDSRCESQTERIVSREKELAAITAIADYADTLSLASSLLEAEDENVKCGKFIGGSLQTTVACMVAASVHHRFYYGEVRNLISRHESEREKAFHSQKASAVDLVHPAAVGFARKNSIMLEYVPWVREICVAEERKKIAGSSRRRRATHHLSSFPFAPEILETMATSSFST